MANVVGCTCGQTHGNTGLPNCVQQIKKALGLGVLSMVANDGVVNKIDLTDLGSYDFLSQIQNPDRSKRIYPIMDLRNVTHPDEAEQYATDSAGGKVEVRDVAYKMAAEVWEVSPAFVGKLKQGKCSRNGIWIFNADGMVGLRRGTDLYPIEIKAYAPKYSHATDADPSKAMISFDYAQGTKVEELWLISWDELGMTINDVVGLIDVNFTIVDAPADGGTNTTVSYALSSDYGFGNPEAQNVDGLDVSQFTCINKTTGLPITLVSVVETADVKYLFTLPSQTTADVVEIAMNNSSSFEGAVTFVQPA
jgi:hypothetical protein